MFAIVSTDNTKRRWISGVFEVISEAEKEISIITEVENNLHYIVDTDVSQFPVFVIENHDFTFGGIELVKENLHSCFPIGNDDFCHFNIFIISEPYKPCEPGCDEMGRLMHWHVTDDDLLDGNPNRLIKIISEWINDV